jgi:hypothetical protein
LLELRLDKGYTGNYCLGLSCATPIPRRRRVAEADGLSESQTRRERRWDIIRRFLGLALWQQIVAGLVVLAIAAVAAGVYKAMAGASSTPRSTAGRSASAPPSMSTNSSQTASTGFSSAPGSSSDVTVGSAVAEHGYPGMSSDQFDVILSSLQNSGSLSATTTLRVSQPGFAPMITGLAMGGGRAVNGVALISPFSTLGTLEIDISGVGGSGSLELKGFATTVTCPIGSADYQITCLLSGS